MVHVPMVAPLYGMADILKWAVVVWGICLIGQISATDDYHGLSDGEDGSYAFIDFAMNISMPWQYCMELDANDTHESLICDRIPLYEAIPQIQDLWRTQAENIRFVQLDCRQGCWCMDVPIPDEDVDEFEECEPDTDPQYHYRCDTVEVSTTVLNKMQGMKRFYVNDIHIIGEPLDFLNSSQNIQEIHFIHTNMTMRQLPHFCDFANLKSIIMIGNQLKPDIFNTFCGDQSSFPGMLEQLILVGEGIDDMPTDAFFPKAVNLTDLSLARNSLHEIPREAFLNMRKLKYLDLAENLLTNISDINWMNTPNIVRLNLSNNWLTEVRCRSFEALSLLEDLDLGSNFISAILGNFNILPNLEWLVLNDNNLTTIGHHFSGSNNLVRLDLNRNNFSSLPANLTERVPKLAMLDLSGNHLQPHDVNDALQPGQNFDRIDLSFNGIISLENTSLSNLESLRNMDETERHLGSGDGHGCLIMRGNKIEVLNLDVYAHMTEIKRLDMSSNQLHRIKLTQPFSGRIDELILDENHFTNTPTILQNLRIKTISLNSNGITSLRDLFLPNNLETLNICSNKLSDLGQAQPLSGLQKLRISNNNISGSSFNSSHFCEQYRALRELNISRNNINEDVFTESWLRSCNQISTVDLSYNQVHDVTNMVTSNPWTRVDNLYLKGNPIIKPLPARFFGDRYAGSSLDFDGYSDPGVRGGLYSSNIALRHLDLSNCGITALPARLFYQLKKISTVDFTNNKIEWFFHLAEELPYARILLAGNPLRATCNMAWLKYTPELRRYYRFTYARDMVSEQRAVFDDVPIQHFLCRTYKSGCDRPGYKCDCLSISATAKPSRLMCRNRGLTDVPNPLPTNVRDVYMENNHIPELDFNKYEKSTTMVETIDLRNCSIKTIRENAFSRFPKLIELWLDDNQLTVFVMEMFVGLSHLELLSLANNKIEEIIAPDALHNFTVLRELNLKSNQLRNISEEVHRHLLKQTHLVLVDNPWECDSCQGLVAFLAKISHYAVQNIDLFLDIECHNLPNISVRQMVTDFDSGECSEDNPSHGKAGISITALSCLIVLVIPAIYVCRTQLLVLAHTAVPAMRRRRPESPLPYDAFIVYNGRDAVRHWVLDVLRPRLEDEEGYRLFLMERDSVVGADEMATRRIAMKHSKRTVLIVGEDFSTDPYSLYSFRLAHRYATDEYHHSVLVILHNGNNPAAASEHDAILKAYIDMNQYIAVENRLFWPSLLSAMPYQPDSLDERLRHFNNIDLEETRPYILPYDYVNRYRQTVTG